MVQALPYPEDRAATLSQMPVQQKVFTIAGVADEKERHRVLGEMRPGDKAVTLAGLDPSMREKARSAHCSVRVPYTPYTRRMPKCGPFLLCIHQTTSM